MKLSQEDVVTKMLSDREILSSNIDLHTKMYATNPAYDLTHFLNTYEPEPSRWGEKYKFVT